MKIDGFEGHQFDFSVMFDGPEYPARGRQGGHDGAPTKIIRDDGVALQDLSSNPAIPSNIRGESA